jgi:hypothetical protein
MIRLHDVAPRRFADAIMHHVVEFLERGNFAPLVLPVLVLEVLVGDDAIGAASVAIGGLDPPPG